MQGAQASSAVMLVLPPSVHSSQSLPIGELAQVGLSSHLPGVSQALDTDIDAWRSCKDNTAILPSSVAFEFEKIPACANYWANSQSPLLGKYLLTAGSMRWPRGTYSTAATAIARYTCIGQISHAEKHDAAIHTGSKEPGLGDQVANVEFLVKMFACAFDQFDREKQLWGESEVAKEMGAIVEFGGGGAGEAGSGSMHAQGHCTDRNKAKQGSIAEEHSQKLPVDCSQDFCLQVPCIVMELSLIHI